MVPARQPTCDAPDVVDDCAALGADESLPESAQAAPDPTAVNAITATPTPANILMLTAHPPVPSQRLFSRDIGNQGTGLSSKDVIFTRMA